jgi:hypothetical protein
MSDGSNKKAARVAGLTFAPKAKAALPVGASSKRDPHIAGADQAVNGGAANAAHLQAALGVAEAIGILREVLGGDPPQQEVFKDPIRRGAVETDVAKGSPGLGFKDPFADRPRGAGSRRLFGPGSLSTDGLASQVQHFRVHESGRPDSHFIHVQGSNGSAWVQYDVETGKINDWGRDETLADGTREREHSTYVPGASGDTEVETRRETTTPDGQTRREVERRQVDPSRDPPKKDPVPERTPPPQHTEGSTPERSMTGEEVSGGTLPLGYVRNPITGQVTGGKKLGNDQVNPGKGESPTLTGPKLSIDPHGPVVNPDALRLGGKAGPKVIERPDPGARPGKDVPPKP